MTFKLVIVVSVLLGTFVLYYRFIAQAVLLGREQMRKKSDKGVVNDK